MLLECVGGSAVLRVEKPKCVHIVHQIWPNYRVYLLLFCFFEWVNKIFLSKISPAKSILEGGCTLSTCILGGSTWDRPKLDVFNTFPKYKNVVGLT